jgi:uncharacterized protein (DUF433 family)
VLLGQLASGVRKDVGRPANPLVVSTPGVCGGVERIIRTRIPIWTLERLRQLNSSEADILRSLPSLTASDLTAAWAYVEDHRDAIQRQIQENETD